MGQFTSKPERITFHRLHGDDIDLSEDCAVRAENRSSCWSNGLVFSAEPVKINQKVYIQLAVVSRDSHDVISVGFTSQNPAHTQFFEHEDNSLSWTCTLSKYFCTEDAVVCFYVGADGKLYFAKNRTGFRAWDRKVDVGRTLWAVVHVWSEPTTVKLLTENEAKEVKQVEDVRVEDDGIRKVMKEVGVSPHFDSEEICGICYVNGVEVVFVPCGHLCACFECGRAIEQRNRLCPICRKNIQIVVRVYKS